jgi:hypothetical protein
MEKQQALAVLHTHRAEIVQRFGVRHLALFGSTARGDARPDSDVDVLVDFSEGATLRGYMGLKFYLEAVLNQAVDLVTQQALRKELRPRIEKEAIDVT